MAEQPSAARLVPAHLEELARSGIPPELALRAGLWSERDPSVLSKLTGRPPRVWTDAHVPALVFPRIAPGEAEPALYNVKPARALEHKTSDDDGAVVRLLKYVSTAKVGVRLYWPPGLRESTRDRADVGRALFITEGEKKTLAAEAVELLCIGLSGVSCWSEKSGRRRVLHRDFAHVALKGRRVFVVFDSDASINMLGVRREERALLEALIAAGADARVVRLPDAQGGAKQGLDDFLVAHGRAALIALCDAAKAPATKAETQVAGAPSNATALTDLGNAERLVRDHGADLRWVESWSTWIAWDAQRWRRDDTGESMRRASATVRGLYAEAAACADPERRNEIVRHAKKSESHAAHRALLGLARTRTGVAVDVEELDADPWRLTVTNGTIDLRSGLLGAARREDLITQLAPCTFDPAATAPTWEAFLARIFGDTELVAYVRRAVGYALTGHTSEQKLWICYGTGANGKSTFLTAILHALGSYAKQAAPEILVERDKKDPHPTEVADLKGVRWAVCTELEQGRALAEGLVKRLTGEQILKARYMRQDFFSFRATHKLWVATNHKPQVRGTDEAIWRRLVLVPFTVTIPEAERDATLLDKLTAERAGILAWAVRGCVEWQIAGLREPEVVTAATNDFRSDSDILRGFIDHACIVAPGLSAWARELYRAYEGWCSETGEHQVTQTTFGLRLKERGLTSARGTGGAKRWHGITLNTEGMEALKRSEQLNGSERFPRIPDHARTRMSANEETVHNRSTVHSAPPIDDRSDFSDDDGRRF